MTSEPKHTYQWEGADRTTQVTFPGNTNKMTYAYDGLGRRVKGSFTTNGTTTETRYLWCGMQLCQTRDGQDNVTARLYPEGEYRAPGLKYVYRTDHLGSVRDVVNADTGALVGALDYSPYGQVQRKSGSVTPLYQYGMLPWDGNVGLNVSPTRFYDASVGRWTSRDPIGEAGGINLYGYVGGSPLIGVDPSGLQYEGSEIWGPVGAGISKAIGDAGAVIVGVGGMVWNSMFPPPKSKPVPYVPTRSDPSPSPTARPTTGQDPCLGNSSQNWKSKEFGHTFNRHGSGAKNTNNLMGRAKGTNTPQGQWLDNAKAADFLNKAKAGLNGPASTPIPKGLGQVIMPDGSIVNATRATIVPRGNGISTAYPVP